MNQTAEQTEFVEETVAEAIESAKGKPNQGDGDFEIEVIDDTPEADRGRPRRSEDSESDIPDDDEISKYSEGVQKRIKKLSFLNNEERRAKEEALRLQEEALRFAQQTKSENERLRKTLQEGEGVLVNQAKGRVAAELEKARTEAKSAYEMGDADAMIAANEKVAKLNYEQEKYKDYRPRPAPAPAPQPVYQQQNQPPPNQPSRQDLSWADRNPWFGEHSPNYDPEMTGYAFGLHQKLVKSGIDPRTEEYYNEIDNAVRRVFPDKFGDGQIEDTVPQRQVGNVVAPAARSGKRPRKVQMTSTQVSLAKRLGLSNEQYAAQLMKDMKQ
tara:strand:- start:308 stop:1288 length:981 start_codon:yes stop_codon:yes gene_type:complete